MNPQPPAAPAAPATWRPMAEAPKDGTPIVIRFSDLTMVVAHFMEGGYCIEDHPAIERGWYFYNGHMMDLIPSKSQPISWAVIPPTFNLPPLDKKTGEAVWRICEPNRPIPAPAAPITASEIAELRDALSKATQGEWATGKGGRPMYAGDTQIVGVNDDGDVFILASFNHNFDVSKTNAAFSALAHNLAPKLLAALDAAEAQAVEFAWDAFNRNTEFVYVVNSALPRLRTLTLASESAAEYLAKRKLLRKTGERTWQRVEGI